MLRVTKLLVPVATTLVCVGLFAPPAAANMQVRSVIHVDETYTDSSVCPFDLTVHLHGSFKNVDYYDNSGFLYKTIATVGGGGPFTVSYRANGTTLTQRNEAFSVVLTYNPDGSVSTYTQRGPFNKFTTPGGGIVLLDTGIATWSEPEEDLLFAGGPHQAVNGDFDSFCAAFS
jgi:hypothetical protein